MHTPHLSARARPLTRLGALIVVVLAAALAGPLLSTAGAAERASCNRSQFPTTCDVTEPNVQRQFTGYSQIQLFAGQHVFIQAGGCVQTGGHGKTWKRYVDPAADNDLYHGLIAIPGATLGYVRLSSVVNTTVVIPQDTHDSYLFLGYEDDSFGDNGYWGRAGDDGTCNQCRGLGNAFVHLTITN
jgi:hypothetical protein